MKIAIALAAFLVLLPASSSAEPSEEVITACRKAIPEELREGIGPGETSGANASGKWAIETAQMDGEGSDEVVLVVLPVDAPGEVLFFAERPGKDPVRKRISVKGRVVATATVRFEEFAPDRSLIHVNAGSAGEVLVHWDGSKLRKVWEVGKPRDDERRWFTLEDLDGDEIREVIGYSRRDVDVFYADEEDLGERGGSDDQRQGGSKVDVVSVHRFENGRWRKDKGLLESLR